MTFKVIDTKTGKEPKSRVIDNIARKGGLMTMDIDQFFLGEDGQIVLADDCGNMAYLDMGRFEVVFQPDIEAIRQEIKQAAVKQFQIAMGVTDLNERYAHIQMENAYRHSLGIIDKHTEAVRSATSEERQGIDDYIDSVAENMKDEDINFKVGRENVCGGDQTT